MVGEDLHYTRWLGKASLYRDQNEERVRTTGSLRGGGDHSRQKTQEIQNISRKKGSYASPGRKSI